MSYNSEVCLVINKKAKNAFYKKIEQLNLDDKNLILNFLDECYTKYIKENLALFYWKNYKWYLTDTGVLFIVTFIEDIPETWYKYIKLGDAEIDIEIHGCYINEKINVYLERKIVF